MKFINSLSRSPISSFRHRFELRITIMLVATGVPSEISFLYLPLKVRAVLSFKRGDLDLKCLISHRFME